MINISKNVLLFGGSGAIGSDIVTELLNRGMTVYATYHHNKEALDLITKEKEYEGELHSISCDVTQQESVKRIVEKMHEEQGCIDVLINCVGTMEQSLFIEKSLQTWENTINTNLTSVFLTCHEVVPYMMEEQNGIIINFSSISGMYGMTGIVDYCAAKSGVIGLTKGLAAELGRFGIRVNCVSPGMIETEMTKDSRDKVGKGIRKMIPLRRFGKPEEISGVVAFLLSEDARYITGENIVIGGGAGSAFAIG